MISSTTHHTIRTAPSIGAIALGEREGGRVPKIIMVGVYKAHAAFLSV